MKRITIGGKEYTFEFTIEATLYDECTIKAMETFVNSGVAQADASDNNIKGAMMTMIETMAGVPQRALTFFYAGLLEHHGSNGDKSVLSKDAAKKLVVQYMNENEGKSWYDIQSEMIEIMVEDSFFDKIGLNTAMERMNLNQTEKKPRKRSTTAKSSTTD